MRIKICGIAEVNYISKKTGNPITGQKVYFTFLDQDVRGEACDTAFLRVEQMVDPDIVLPATADLYYNKYGGIDELIIS